MKIVIVMGDRLFELKSNHVLVVNSKTIEIFETSKTDDKFRDCCDSLMKMPIEFLTDIRVIDK